MDHATTLLLFTIPIISFCPLLHCSLDLLQVTLKTIISSVENSEEIFRSNIDDPDFDAKTVKFEIYSSILAQYRRPVFNFYSSLD